MCTDVQTFDRNICFFPCQKKHTTFLKRNKLPALSSVLYPLTLTRIFGTTVTHTKNQSPSDNASRDNTSA